MCVWWWVRGGGTGGNWKPAQWVENGVNVLMFAHQDCRVLTVLEPL